MSKHTRAASSASSQRASILLKAMLVVVLAATVATSTFHMTRTEADNTEPSVPVPAAERSARTGFAEAALADSFLPMKAEQERRTEAVGAVYFEDAPRNVALRRTERTENTTAAPTTAAPTTEATTSLPGYSFYELGLSQWSDIEIPDDIRFGADGRPLNYAYTIRGGATSYYGGVMTSTGASVHPGIVAVDPDIIPYHTRMFIVTDSGIVYGYCVAEDTGGFIYLNDGPTFDVYMWTYDDCCTWGYQNVTAYIFD